MNQKLTEEELELLAQLKAVAEVIKVKTGSCAERVNVVAKWAGIRFEASATDESVAFMWLAKRVNKYLTGKNNESNNT